MLTFTSEYDLVFMLKINRNICPITSFNPEYIQALSLECNIYNLQNFLYINFTKNHVLEQ